jgi:NAD(P)-dependent dehydrogenase (short-subunit alcohol dehydrogenase family)
MSFSGLSTANDILEGVRLDGKHAFITGATGGLGLETAKSFASVGASVTIAGRSPDKVDAALALLNEEMPSALFDAKIVDLASLSSIQSATIEIVAEGRPIDLLVNNAGVMMSPEGKTEDGFETQFGTNHLGHFALTAGLMSLIVRGGRVITLSSGAHLRGSVNLDDLNWTNRDYDPSLAYAQSKTANAWFTLELQRRYSDRFLSLSVHPGVIETDLMRHLPTAVFESMREAIRNDGVEEKTLQQGAATTVWAATAPELLKHGGAYLADCQVAQPVTAADPRNGYAPWLYDAESAKQLFVASENLTGIHFE